VQLQVRPHSNQGFAQCEAPFRACSKNAPHDAVFQDTMLPAAEPDYLNLCCIGSNHYYPGLTAESSEVFITKAKKAHAAWKARHANAKPSSVSADTTQGEGKDGSLAAAAAPAAEAAPLHEPAAARDDAAPAEAIHQEAKVADTTASEHTAVQASAHFW
jgi:hypothetical protein